MRPPKQKQPQVKKGLCRVLEHVDVDVDVVISVPVLTDSPRRLHGYQTKQISVREIGCLVT